MRKQELSLQQTSVEIWDTKYNLKNKQNMSIDINIDGMYKRVAKDLASYENDPDKWYTEFYNILKTGATPAGRILANAGAKKYKPSTSLINCVVSETITDSMSGILEAVKNAGISLAAGCGIGYEFSTLRPSGAFIEGAGASTSGPLSFMNVFDSTCFTILSAGGRRGAQMATFSVWHPDVVAFIESKRESGKFRQFNLSLLIDDDFMGAVKSNAEWKLFFPISKKEYEASKTSKEDIEIIGKKLFWDRDYCDSMGYTIVDNKILCKVYETIDATYLWNLIMRSTYDFAEPGFLLIDNINKYNNNYFCETIRATNPCGEQPLPPEGSCLLGSLNIAKYILNPFTENARFDIERYIKDIWVFSRMLDNVVENNGLPLTGQRESIEDKRRHGMGFTGLGSAMSLLGIAYGSKESLVFAEEVQKTLAVESYRAGVVLAKEKGACPLLQDMANRIKWVSSPFLQRIWEVDPLLKEEALKYGCRYTHATSVAPTGTISLSVNNNCSNGIEPSFSHKYTRNVIVAGKNSKVAVDVYSYELLLYKHLTGKDEAPEEWSTSDNVTPAQHVDIQAVVQKWCDSSISKTINVPTATPFDEFKDIYMYAYDKGLKGCTTFRFNPETLQGVLVKEDDLKDTNYIFKLEDGTEVVANGMDIIEYKGESVQANNLYDSIKENYFGKH